METSPLKPKAVVVFSGGLDSTTLVYECISRGYEIHLVSFNYGQRHKKELLYALGTARRLDLRHDVVDLSGLAPLLSVSGSSLVSEEAVPEGHYAADNMAKTIVPNRNMMMLSVAVSIAVAREAQFVITGVHAGDHAVYPDCRPEFIIAASYAAILAQPDTAGFRGIQAPYVSISKEDIALKAIELGVPLEATWSCYKGGDIHCGKCGTCVERLEAIHGAQGRYDGTYDDYTQYEDAEFWKTATQEYQENN